MSDPWLKGPVTTSAYGWRLERRDGVALGFTSHDRNAQIDGLLYRASPGMEPTSIVESIGIETDGLEVSGALDADAINEEDLNAGRWDKARLTIFLYDWSAPETGKRILAHGELGEVSFSDHGFRSELRGMTSFLDGPVVPQTSPGCRAHFCDHACGLNAQRFAHLVTISAVNGTIATFGPNPVTAVSDAFAYGHLRWLSGKNAGLSEQILASGTDHVLLADPPPFTVAPSTLALLTEGCNKTIATCSQRFGNAINFRGEPFLPGNDLLTRYPGAR
jgi:uncharacterized phage protein (TIGR02218 family)